MKKITLFLCLIFMITSCSINFNDKNNRDKNDSMNKKKPIGHQYKVSPDNFYIPPYGFEIIKTDSDGTKHYKSGENNETIIIVSPPSSNDKKLEEIVIELTAEDLQGCENKTKDVTYADIEGKEIYSTCKKEDGSVSMKMKRIILKKDEYMALFTYASRNASYFDKKIDDFDEAINNIKWDEYIIANTIIKMENH